MSGQCYTFLPMDKTSDRAFHLDHAPIVEALIDFRVRPVEGASVERLKALHPLIRERYPVAAEGRQIYAQFGLQDGKPITPSHSETLLGFRFESADRLYVFQAHKEGFTLSRMKPYQTWELLRDEARTLWEYYRQIAEPLAVTRTALRYINRLELPLAVDCDHYLTVAPQVPPSLPQVVEGFLSRVVVPFDSGIQVVITQALEPANPITKTTPVILDIDVSLEKSFSIGDEGYWETLEQLRRLKNDAFFGSVTNKTLELCK